MVANKSRIDDGEGHQDKVATHVERKKLGFDPIKRQTRQASVPKHRTLLHFKLEAAMSISQYIEGTNIDKVVIILVLICGEQNLFVKDKNTNSILIAFF